MVDVVYPLSNGSRHNDWELRYSLRSLEKYALGLDRVFVVGHKPDWLTGVVHLPHHAPHANKDADIIHKLRLACNSGISDRFIFASDDQCILQTVDLRSLPAYYRSKPKCKSKWISRLRAAIRYTKQHGGPGFHFDTHTWQPHCRTEFLNATQDAPYNIGNGFTVNTLVLNLSPSIPKQPFGKDCRLRFRRKRHGNDDGLLHQLQTHVHLGYNNDSMTPKFRQTLQSLFPTPSRFEIVPN